MTEYLDSEPAPASQKSNAGKKIAKAEQAEHDKRIEDFLAGTFTSPFLPAEYSLSAVPAGGAISTTTTNVPEPWEPHPPAIERQVDGRAAGVGQSRGGGNWLVVYRGDLTSKLRSKHPKAFLLLSLIAERVRYTDDGAGPLRLGEAFIGDYREAGLETVSEYRAAKRILSDWRLCTFRRATNPATTPTTNRHRTTGTVATLVNSSVFDPFRADEKTANDQPCDHPSDHKQECSQEGQRNNNMQSRTRRKAPRPAEPKTNVVVGDEFDFEPAEQPAGDQEAKRDYLQSVGIAGFKLDDLSRCALTVREIKAVCEPLRGNPQLRNPAGAMIGALTSAITRKQNGDPATAGTAGGELRRTAKPRYNQHLVDAWKRELQFRGADDPERADIEKRLRYYESL